MKAPVAAALLLLAAMRADAQAPARIHYQGRLVHGTNLYNGTVPIVLGLYTNATPTGGEALLYGTTNQVGVVDGLYSTFLGGGSNAASLLNALAHPAVFLQVAVSNSVLLPREPVAAAGYALLAEGLGRTTIVARTQTALRLGTNGLFGQAAGFVPNFGVAGLFIECAEPDGESSGIFLNGNTLVLWSPGDNNDLVRVYDSDTFVDGPKMQLDSDGNLYLAGRLYETNQFTGAVSDESELRRRVADLEARVAELERILAPR